MHNSAKWMLALVIVGISSSVGFSQDRRVSGRDRATPKVLINNLEGVYLVTGQMSGNGPGQQYKGTAVILKHNDTYRIEWRIGNDKFLGAGLREGKQLAATWATVKAGKLAAGTLLYQIERGDKGPRLVGRWTGLLGDGVVHQETLQYVEPVERPKNQDEKKPLLKI